MEKDTTNALVIVDVQNDFCPGGALAVPEGDAVVPLINSIAPWFDVVIATQDWHPAGHVSFASRHPGKKPFDTVIRGGREETLWPDHCVAGSSGAGLHPGLGQEHIKMILRKGTHPEIDAYSAFLENDRKTKTGLKGYLASLGIRQVYITGLATDYCVYFTATDAFWLGFETSVIIDACRGIDHPRGTLHQAIGDMARRGIRIMETGEL